MKLYVQVGVPVRDGVTWCQCCGFAPGDKACAEPRAFGNLNQLIILESAKCSWPCYIVVIWPFPGFKLYVLKSVSLMLARATMACTEPIFCMVALRSSSSCFCFAGQFAPGAFEKQVAIVPNSLLLALVCGEHWNSEK